MRLRSRSTSRCSEVVSSVSGRPSRRRSKMPLGAGELGVAQLRLLGDQLARLLDVAGHEDAERDAQDSP